MRILVGITSYGTAHDQYLAHIVKQYRSVSHTIDIVVFSNIERCVDGDVKVVVGLPNKDPWSLPFAHKPYFADRLNDYDLFIYSEDDIVITTANIDAFMRMSAILPRKEIAGFLRIELDAHGRRYFPDVHAHYHWLPDSLRSRGGCLFANFSNEHAACYLITQQQLRSAINSGGFLVPPYQGRYDLACTASTDPYTQCGFVKLICISDLEGFLVHHLSNKYLGTSFDTAESYLKAQIGALRQMADKRRPAARLLEAEKPHPYTRWSKHYYEVLGPDVRESVPHGAKSLLSVGCGWGALEAELVQKGMKVVAIPLDSVISACAELKGVDVTPADFPAAYGTLRGQCFDCILVSNILHLVRDPIEILSGCKELLSPSGRIVITGPDFGCPRSTLGRLLRKPSYRDLNKYGRSGLHATSHRIIRGWLRKCGLEFEEPTSAAQTSVTTFARWFGPASRRPASDLVVRCKRTVQ